MLVQTVNHRTPPKWLLQYFSGPVLRASHAGFRIISPLLTKQARWHTLTQIVRRGAGSTHELTIAPWRLPNGSRLARRLKFLPDADCCRQFVRRGEDHAAHSGSVACHSIKNGML